MRNLWIVFALVASSVSGVAADGERWIATSRTAMAITGDIVVSADRIVFSNGASIALMPLGADRPGVYAVLPPRDLALLHGNELCGRGPIRFVVLARVGTHSLALKVFDSEPAPAPAADHLPQPGMCALYHFERSD